MYLTELWEAAPTGASAIHHAKLVRDAFLLRAIIHAANELLRDAYSPTMPAEELLALAERKLFELSTSAVSARAVRQIGAVVSEVLSSIDGRIADGAALVGLSSGFPDLDVAIGGFRPGELIVVGARPSLGKTALSLNIAERVAAGGASVLFFSLEMPAEDIATRLLAMQSSVPMHRMSRPRELRDDDFGAIAQAASGMGAMPLYIDDLGDQTAARLASVSRQTCRRHATRLIVIDYLQLMRPENPRDNRNQQVGTLALRVKQMARSLSVPVILLSQLNRELETAARRPRLSDLRESGDIEAHADRVILLHREPNLSHDDPVWPVELLIAKNRNGPIGDVRLRYRRPVLRFESDVIV
jgi:replicative DNA helicase